MEISRQVIGLTIELHRQLGPGLLESAYQKCLCQELRDANVPFARQVALPIIYQDRRPANPTTALSSALQSWMVRLRAP